MLSKYQLKIADLYKFLLATLKSFCLTFLIKKVCDSLSEFTTLLKARSKTKNNTSRIRIQLNSSHKKE